MKLLEKYLYERKGALVKNHEFGFVVYKYFPEKRRLWIIDTYVEASHRKKGYASMMIDQILKGIIANEIVTHVDFSFSGGEQSLMACLKYGFKWHTALGEKSVELIKVVDNG